MQAFFFPFGKLDWTELSVYSKVRKKGSGGKEEMADRSDEKEARRMKRKLTKWLILSAVIMLLFPWLAVTFVKGDAGMGVCFILFFAVNPVYCAIAGVFAGRDLPRLWFSPIAAAALFIAGTWLNFDMGEPAFILYGGFYLVLGFAAMFVSAQAKKKREKRTEK